VSDLRCRQCDGPVVTGGFVIVCLKCAPEYGKPCAWCRAAFYLCRCDGVSAADEARFEAGWRPEGWVGSAQAALSRES
jgi:hypothetical protein